MKTKRQSNDLLSDSIEVPASEFKMEEHVALPEDAMIIIPVRNLVLFPGMVMPVTIGRDVSIAAAQEAVRSDLQVCLLLQKNPLDASPTFEDLHPFGTVGDILRYVTTPDGLHHVVVQGEQRFRVVKPLEGYPFMAAYVERFEEQPDDTSAIEARMLQLKEKTSEMTRMWPQVPKELAEAVQKITSPAALADLVVGVMEFKPEEKQGVLETLDLQERLDKVLVLLSYRVEVMRISRDIDKQTKDRLGDFQREAMLREHLKKIGRAHV